MKTVLKEILLKIKKVNDERLSNDAELIRNAEAGKYPKWL